MTARHLCTVLLWVALALAASPAYADLWYEHYDRAEKAIARSEWQEAMQELDSALEKRAESSARARTYGMNVSSYFPYLKLGEAYLRLGHVDAALQAFETERRLGAVTESARDLESLELLQSEAAAAKAQLEQEEAQRSADIAKNSLLAAEKALLAGDLEQAIEAVGRAQSVDPENLEASNLMERIHAALAAERHRELVAKGRRLLAESDFEGALRVLRQAEAANPTGEVLELLATVLAERSADAPAAEPTTRIEPTLDAAAELESQGELAAALEQLAPLLVSSRPSAEALAAEQRLMTTLARQRLNDEVALWLATATSDRAAGRLEASLVAANRALALDRNNNDALALIRATYQDLGQQLLGASTSPNLPPAIHFADLRQELEDGSLAHIVTRPLVHITGVVIDGEPTTVTASTTGGDEPQISMTSQSAGGVVISQFDLRPSLEPGRTVFEIHAEDPTGLSTSLRYAVIYQRPLLRSPWVLGSAIAVIAGLSLLIPWRRRRHRRRQLKRRFNPFVAGSPVLDESLFFGREQLIERILQTIHNNSLLLFGERRIGKTSLQHHLKRRLEALDDPDYVFFPVFVDLQGVPEEAFFATISSDIWDELGSRLHPLKPDPKLSQAANHGYRELVAELRRILAQLASTTEKRVRLVLLMDEVDELNAYDPRVSQRLRSLFMKSFADSMVAVVSGVAIKHQWDREGSPWFNFFEEIEVSAISRESARELVRFPLRGVLTVDDQAVERILDFSKCRPYAIQRLCVALVNRAHNQTSTRITIADVDAEAPGKDVQAGGV